jgi:hypothetical protein
MKPLLTLLMVMPLFSLAQVKQPGTYFAGDTLYTLSGFKIVQGEKLTIGGGSMQGGEFRYIRISSYSFFRRSSNKVGEKPDNAFSPHYKGLQFEVIRIDRRGNKKQTYDYFPIISAGVVRYEIDIDNAIASGEIVVPEQYKPKQPLQINQQQSGRN